MTANVTMDSRMINLETQCLLEVKLGDGSQGSDGFPYEGVK
jgi:hypothetical protein